MANRHHPVLRDLPTETLGKMNQANLAQLRKTGLHAVN